MLEKTFGKFINGKDYKDRIGAYAIIINSSLQVGAVKTNLGYFLIGGGVENGESYEQCLVRETLEEIGYNIKINNFICKSDFYGFSEQKNRYVHPIGYFYEADLIEKICNPIEYDHKLIWLDYKEYKNKLFFEHQSWAVEKALEKYNI